MHKYYLLMVQAGVNESLLNGRLLLKQSVLLKKTFANPEHVSDHQPHEGCLVISEVFQRRNPRPEWNTPTLSSQAPQSKSFHTANIQYNTFLEKGQRSERLVFILEKTQYLFGGNVWASMSSDFTLLKAKNAFFSIFFPE